MIEKRPLETLISPLMGWLMAITYIEWRLGTQCSTPFELPKLTTFSAVAIVAWYSLSWQAHETLGLLLRLTLTSEPD